MTQSQAVEYLYNEARAVDPLGDVEREQAKSAKHNRAKVGAGRPSSLLYTYGPGSIMDLPQFTIMPTGLDDWDRIWARRDGDPPVIHAPRLRDVVRMHLRSPNVQLRPHPWQPKRISFSAEGNDLGVPARVFPQWLRCTGCDMLGFLSQFGYANTHPFRTDLACFEHVRCTGRPGSTHKPNRRTAVPARYLLACVAGHLDEFPYDLWVHHGKRCAKAEFPALRMIDRTAGKGASAMIRCESCDQQRPMNEAQGEAGSLKLPKCRGRHPHLDGFEPNGCGLATKLMLIGASNLWFPATYSIIVMPESAEERVSDLADQIRIALGDRLARYADDLETLGDVLEGRVNMMGVTDEALRAAVAAALAPPPSAEEADARLRDWDPIDLIVPEWRYLQQDPIRDRHEDAGSGLTLSKRQRGGNLRPEITRVLAVEKLRKVNALIGFTRIDALDRVGDLRTRLVPLTRNRWPDWTVATEDRGEGIFLQLDEAKVASWEERVSGTSLWEDLRAAHERNFERRFSETAADVDPDSRLRPPRYWLVHTLAHVLIRELAMTCGYSAASLSERLYAWPVTVDRAPAAGLLIVTTAADSDGTLGGLVHLSEPLRLEQVVAMALKRATRCSSDPLCARRTPRDPEDFLHGAACHCCVMASETSCERANRFLDRRFLIDLPGSELGFFRRVS